MFDQSKYDEYTRKILDLRSTERIILPEDEYAHVISELNSNMSETDKSKKLVTKPIGDYYYTVINQGFNEYVIIGKRPIISDVENEWGKKE